MIFIFTIDVLRLDCHNLRLFVKVISSGKCHLNIYSKLTRIRNFNFSSSGKTNLHDILVLDWEESSKEYQHYWMQPESY